MDMRMLEGMMFLMEPMALKVAIQRVASFKTCPTPREMARSRRKSIEYAKAAPSRAVASTGRDDPAEIRMGPRAIRGQSGKVGVIGIHGAIEQRRTAEMDKAGGTSAEEASYALDSLLADPAVSAIVLHVDSPGGGVSGVGELADKIYAARDRKPIYSIADSMSASAAYWLSSAASTSICTPGGLVGSHGVYAIHADESEAMKQAGVKVSVVQAGKFKTEFLPSGPLGDDARAFLQETVDSIYQRFTAGLAQNRGKTKSDVMANFGQGRVVDADKALASGMIDRVMSFQQLMAKLTGGGGWESGNKVAASAEVLRLRHARQVQVAARA